MKKQNSNYESPKIKMLQLDAEDVLTASGDTYFEWGWGETPDNVDFS